MPHYVYILYSKTIDHFYTGISDFKTKRQRQHSRGQSSWTSRADDWMEVWSVNAASLNEARALEKKTKAFSAEYVPVLFE